VPADQVIQEEDLVLVTAEGRQRLTRYTKELVSVA
jgi:hypothetical protein